MKCLLQAEYFPDAVVDAVVVCIFALMALCSLYHSYGYGQYQYLVERFQYHLRDDEYGQFFQWHHATKCQWEKMIESAVSP